MTNNIIVSWLIVLLSVDPAAQFVFTHALKTKNNALCIYILLGKAVPNYIYELCFLTNSELFGLLLCDIILTTSFKQFQIYPNLDMYILTESHENQ